MQTTYLIASDEDLNRQLRFVFGFCCCHGCSLLGLGLPLLLLLGLAMLRSDRFRGLSFLA